MKRDLQGRYVTVSTVGEEVKAYIPLPLPPAPELSIDGALQNKLDQAVLELGRLDSVSKLLPDIGQFLYMYIRKEAVLSSMIEGTQSSLSDLLMFESDEAPGAPLDDVQEVISYVAALNHGIKRLNEGFPLSIRLLREIHEVLLSNGRGGQQMPGEFRQSQNWIGGTRPGNAFFVPPPADDLQECLGALELFLNDQNGITPTLVKAALVHVQFETIHPFLDGNGRLGRLLITLLLVESGMLQTPLLYISYYFKLHRQYYYDLLNDVRINGDWERWLDFFAEAIIVTAGQGVKVTGDLNKLVEHDRSTIKTLGRNAVSALQVFEAMLCHPIAGAKIIGKLTGLTPATVNKSLKNLIQLDIVEELTSQKRNRLFYYSKYLDILNEGMETHDRR
ncbi:MAG: Fic family protein [Planctomycetota bacterium]|jgi:Fic family protein